MFAAAAFEVVVADGFALAAALLLTVTVAQVHAETPLVGQVFAPFAEKWGRNGLFGRAQLWQPHRFQNMVCPVDFILKQRLVVVLTRQCRVYLEAFGQLGRRGFVFFGCHGS